MDSNTFWVVFWGIVGSILGAIAVLLLQQALSYFKARRGFHTGEWEQVIYDADGKAEKRDRVTIHHEGETFKGLMRRLEPVDQSFRSWHLLGRIESNMIFCIYWSTNFRVNPGSYGTIQLHMINHWDFTGFYVKLVVSDKLTEFSEAFTSTRLQWKRIALK
jgi:hypothetical protein